MASSTPDAEPSASTSGHVDVPRPPDVVRRLALLWDPPQPSGRGRKPRLTLDDVVAAGTRLADRDGLDGLSMRKVAGALDVGAMSLYTYVPGRTELLDQMIDRAFGELEPPTPGAPWRAGLAQHARQHWDLYHRHPWVLQTNMWRLPLTPHVLDAQEAGLRTIVDTGLAPAQVVEILGLVDAFVRGLARADVAESTERDSSGVAFDDYWTSMSSFWADHFDPERYPTMQRIWDAGGFDGEQAPFETSLGRLLDSVEMAIDRATGTR